MKKIFQLAAIFFLMFFRTFKVFKTLRLPVFTHGSAGGLLKNDLQEIMVWPHKLGA